MLLILGVALGVVKICLCGIEHGTDLLEVALGAVQGIGCGIRYGKDLLHVI